MKRTSREMGYDLPIHLVDPNVKRDSFIIWIFFILLVSVVPTLIVMASLANGEEPMRLEAVFGRGELYSSGLAIAADASGRLAGKGISGGRLFVLCMCVILAVLGAAGVAIIVTSPTLHGTMGTAWFSSTYFFFCLTASLGAKLIEF